MYKRQPLCLPGLRQNKFCGLLRTLKHVTILLCNSDIDNAFFKNIGLFKVHFLNDFGFGKVMVKSILNLLKIGNSIA